MMAMMIRVIIVSLWVTLGFARAADTLQPSDISAHVGQTITVSGHVSEVFTDRRSGNTFLDMGGTYPGNRFTAVIFPESAGEFPDPQHFSGKFVRITASAKSRSSWSPPSPRPRM